MVTLANPRQRDDSRRALLSDFQKPTDDGGHDDNDTLVCLFTSLTPSTCEENMQFQHAQLAPFTHPGHTKA